MYCNGSEADRSRFSLILKDHFKCTIFTPDTKMDVSPKHMFLGGENDVTVVDFNEVTSWEF